MVAEGDGAGFVVGDGALRERGEKGRVGGSIGVGGWKRDSRVFGRGDASAHGTSSGSYTIINL